MLKSYVCVACEKLIFAKDDVASLIGLFTKIIITVAPGTEIPRNAVTPKEWAVYSNWIVEPGDESREYIHCMQILYPDGTQFGDIARSKINIEPNKRAQVGMQFIGFPIGQLGLYKVRTWVEENQSRVVGPIEFELEVSRHEVGEPVKQEQASTDST